MFKVTKLATVAAAITISAGLAIPTASAQPATISAYDNCASGWICLYSQTGGFGEKLQFQDEGYWQNLRFTAKSVYNNRSHDAAIAVGTGGSGGSFCINSGLKNGNITGKSVYLAFTGNNC
ncbi:peptidase inhibitor family I36 protein [Streptomyces lushanensis]|uniref:peptidase inhibitor family I36 protein n=1 Tax=Streptomyces lushanensis TaxID=1434255 RepID=UPI0008347C20|nr:peptidase inhibitor family I36 protein [Streptomyces lushanensis]